MMICRCLCINGAPNDHLCITSGQVDFEPLLDYTTDSGVPLQTCCSVCLLFGRDSD